MELDPASTTTLSPRASPRRWQRANRAAGYTGFTSAPLVVRQVQTTKRACARRRRGRGRARGRQESPDATVAVGQAELAQPPRTCSTMHDRPGDRATRRARRTADEARRANRDSAFRHPRSRRAGRRARSGARISGRLNGAPWPRVNSQAASADWASAPRERAKRDPRPSAPRRTEPATGSRNAVSPDEESPRSRRDFFRALRAAHDAALARDVVRRLRRDAEAA